MRSFVAPVALLRMTITAAQQDVTSCMGSFSFASLRTGPSLRSGQARGRNGMGVAGSGRSFVASLLRMTVTAGVFRMTAFCVILSEAKPSEESHGTLRPVPAKPSEESRPHRNSLLIPPGSQVLPLRVDGFDECNLLPPQPALDLLLSFDGGPDVGRGLEVNQAVKVVPRRERRLVVVHAMFGQTPRQVTGNAGVEHDVGAVGEDVHG